MQLHALKITVSKSQTADSHNHSSESTTVCDRENTDPVSRVTCEHCDATLFTLQDVFVIFYSKKYAYLRI